MSVYVRFDHAIEELREAAPPELHRLIDEVSNLSGDLWSEAEAIGVARHGVQIMEMISGKRYQWWGCVPGGESEGPPNIEALAAGVGRG